MTESPSGVSLDILAGHQCEEPLLLTIDEAAEQLRVKPWTVYQLCKGGLLVGSYLGPKTLRIRPDDLRAYVAGLPSERPEAANAALA